MTNVTSFILFYFPKVLSSCFRLYFVIRRYSLNEREIESDNPFFSSPEPNLLLPEAEPFPPRSRGSASPEPRNFLHTRKLNFPWHETVIIPVLYPPFPGV